MLIKEHECNEMPDDFGVQYNKKWEWHLIEWDAWVTEGIKYCPFCGVKLK